MRAPDKPSGDDEDEWKRIKTSLKAVGVDADGVRIGPGISAKQRWTLKGYVNETVRCSLRDELPYIIERCDIDLKMQMASSTPQELANKQDRIIKRCRELLADLDEPSNYNRINPESHWLQFRELSALVDRAIAVLQPLAAELGRNRDELAAMGTSRGKHRRMLHVQFLKALERIFLDNVRAGVKWHRSNHLAKFLIACSRPFFPKEMTDGAVKAFIERRDDSCK
jgi:hypothetical protein